MAKDAILHLAPRKARTMERRGHVERLSDEELAEMEPGFYSREAEPCKPCGKSSN